MRPIVSRNRFSRLRRETATSSHDVVDRDVAALLAANELQRGGDVLVFDGDDVGRAARDDAERFDNDLLRLANPALHHAIEQRGGAVAGRFRVQRDAR